MPIYIINKSTGEVHLKNGCGNQPEGNNWETITGNPKNLDEAVQMAKSIGYPNAKECVYCLEQEPKIDLVRNLDDRDDR